MVGLNLQVDSAPSPMERVIAAAPRLLLGAAFIVIGWSKLGAHSSWVPLFQKLGVGQWFRYLTGTMQVSGGVLTLLRRTTIAGAALIACTMAGAVVADAFVLGYGLAAVIPFVLLASAVGVAVQAWANADSG